MIYKPLDVDNPLLFINKWNELANKNGLPGFFFIGVSYDVEKEYEIIKSLGFDAIFSCSAKRINERNLTWLKNMILRYVFAIPARYDFRKIYKHLVGEKEKREDVYPLIIPNWDHTPRSIRNGYILTHTTPEVFTKHVEYVLEAIKDKNDENKICFLKSWNEWGEGNYMEPDIKYGRAYIDALKKSLEKYK
jgi:hypothetical protein